MWLPCVVLTIQRWRELRNAEQTVMLQAAIIARLKTELGWRSHEDRQLADRIAPDTADFPGGS